MVSLKKNKEIFLFYYSLLLVGLTLATVNLNNSFLIWLLIGGSALLLFKPIYLLPVFIISSLSSDYFVAGAGIGISRIIGIIIIVSGIIFFLRFPKLTNKKNFIFIITISVFSFISSAFSLTTSFHAFFQFMQYFAIILIIGQFRDVNILSLTQLLAISSILTILVLAFTLKENLITLQAQRLTTGEEVNENRFAMMVAQLSAIVFSALLIFKKHKIIQVFLFLVLLLSFFMLILSGSRSATIGISGTVIFFILYLFKKQKNILPFAIIIGVILLFLSQLQTLDIPYINRFSIDDVVESGGANRLTTWKKLVPITLKNNPLFGNGFGALNVIHLAMQNGLKHPAHNFIIDMFLQVGLLGCILFFSYFLHLAKKLKSFIHEPLIFIPVAILLTALLNGIGETVFPEKLFWNGIALAWLYLNNLPNVDYKQTSNI